MKDIMTLLVLLLVFVTSRITQGLNIIPPYPLNYIVIEGEPLTIPCVAGDKNSFPSKVTFKKKNPGDSTFNEIKPNKTVSITNSTYYDQKKGLFIKKCVLQIPYARYPYDGTPQGKSYECWSQHGRKDDEFSFTIYVIPKSSLPRAFIQATKITPYEGSASLTCNVTYRGNADAQLQKFMWIKRSSVIRQGASSVPPITITKATTQDGGLYVCAAEVYLKSTKRRQIKLDSATLNIQLKMMAGATRVTANVSDNVVMECPAEGYPLNVTWFRVNKNGQEVKLSEVPRMRDRVVFTRPCYYCRYRMTIYNMERRDGGHFVCKANTHREFSRHHSFLYVSTPSETTVATTMIKPTTVVTTEHESTPVPSKSNLVIVTITIVLGLLLGLLLIMNGFLLYKLRLGHIRLQDLPTEPDTKPEKIEIVEEGAIVAGHESPTIEFQPLVETKDNQPTEQTESAQENTPAKPSTIAVQDGGPQNEKEVKQNDSSERRCSIQCSGVSQGDGESKYEEPTQDETTYQITISTKTSSRRRSKLSQCSLM